MRGSLAIAIVLPLAGCFAGDEGDDMGDDAPSLPPGCDAARTLVGGVTPGDSLPITIGATPYRVCLHLDATHNLVEGHFMASTAWEDGATASFGLALVEADGTLVRDGWELVVGQTAPRACAHLEWSMPAGTVRDMILEASVHAPAGSTVVGVDLFEPLD